MSNFKTSYYEKHQAAIQKELGLGNIMQVPRMTKITVNMGLGEALQNSKLIESGIDQLRVITGQQPVVTKAKKSISNFKLREGAEIGCKVTLRGRIMYEFLDRLVTVALPRVRDFRGLNGKSFDGGGNYAMGIKEQIVFPEIDYDNVNSIRGMNVTFVTSAETDYEAYELLVSLGFPINEYKNKKSGKGLSSSDKSNKPTVEEDLSLNEDANVDNVNQETTEEESS